MARRIEVKHLKIAVAGGGSWATALVKMLCENLENLGWWMRNAQAVQHIEMKKHNPNYLSAVELPIDRLTLSTDLNRIAAESDCIIFAIPAAFLTPALEELGVPLKEKVVVSAIKGIVPEGNRIIGQYFIDEQGVPRDRLAVITGPCHAEEVALEKLSYLTVACENQRIAKKIARALRSDYIQTKISTDIYGAEYAAVLKNVYAIAAGIAHSLGYGDNFQAVLLSNAIREMSRFLAAVHPIERDIKDLAYLGDLLVTAYSSFSRNRMFGNMIGKGYTVRAAQLEMNMIAEGYYAASGIQQVKEAHGLKMPIASAVYSILYGGKSPEDTIEMLSTTLD